MDKTPKNKSKQCVRPAFQIGGKNGNEARDIVLSNVNTPLAGRNLQEPENDYSPLYFQTTQEANEEIDVLWDWHSPQTSQKRRKKQKRLLPVQSPNIPSNRCTQNTQHNFEKLRNELKALQEELAMPHDESCLCISPLQEIEFKEEPNNTQPNHFEEEDLFNDSIDDQLLLHTQKIENNLNHSQNEIYESEDIDKLISKYCENVETECKESTTPREEHLNSNIFSSKQTKLPLHRTVSENNYHMLKHNIVHTASGKLEFHRTKSFEMASVCEIDVDRELMEEIEKKKMEALAKLESKRKENLISTCSYEEIEKKRLQALAKLQAKRIEDIVEKKRQEALKKLQMNRMKNASQVKSALTKRL